MLNTTTSTCVCLLMLGMIHIIWYQTDALRQGFAPGWIVERYCQHKHGIMKVPWDCSGYLHCTTTYSYPSGAWIECGETLQFDGRLLSCVRSASDCLSGSDVADAICPANPDLTFPHPDSCVKFYDCSQTAIRADSDLEKYESMCPHQQLFDPETGRCEDDQDDVYCNNKATKRCDNGQECQSADEDCVGKPYGVNPKDDAVFTSEYILCQSGRGAVTRVCNVGYVFDPVRKECSPNIIESVKTYCRMNRLAVFSDAHHCARYYNCSMAFRSRGLSPYQRECPYMSLFDPAHSTCVRYNSLATPCGTRFEPIDPCDYKVGHCIGRTNCIPCDARCKGKNNGPHPYPSYPNTRFYLVCEGGRTLNVSECSDGLIFSSQGRECVPQKAARTTVPRYKLPVQPTTQPPVCACMKTIGPLAKSLQNLTSFIDDTLLHLQDANPYDCDQPPRIRNSEVTISYVNGVSVAVYTCAEGYSTCDGQLNSTCVRDNMWNKAFLGECVQDTWINMNNMILSCPPRADSALLIRGRSIEDLYTVSLIDSDNGQTHLHVRLRSTSRTVEAGTTLETMVPVTSQTPLTGQIAWIIEFKATTFEISVNGHHVMTVLHTSLLPRINSVIISAAFQAVQVKFHPNGIGATTSQKHWSPFACPDPPLIDGASVQMSYTKYKAMATYTCDSLRVMCTGNKVIHCYDETGWDTSPGSCLRAVLNAETGGSLSSFPVCPLKLGSGIELWVTPRESTGFLEIFHSKTDIALRLELMLHDTDKPIGLHHVVSGRLSTVKYPLSQPFTKDKESRVIITRLTDQLLIEVDGEVLFQYPADHMNTEKSLFIEASQGMRIKTARISHDVILDVIRKPIDDNLALWANVETSSSYSNPKFFGVDGNPMQSWPTGSCWNAGIGDTNQWYQVDLGTQYYIRNINIDIKTKRILGSFSPAIIVGPTVDGPQLDLSFGSAVIHHCPNDDRSAKITLETSLRGTRFQAIFVTRNYSPGARFTKLRSQSYNLAFNKEAFGSPDYDFKSSPAHAVDGDLDSRRDSGSCYTSHPSVGDPWWMVDLGRDYTISSVAVQRQGDLGNNNHLADMAITIYETNPRTNTSAKRMTCIEKTGILGYFDRLPCAKPMTGQFVMIQRIEGVNKGPITICEVQVFVAIESKLHDVTVDVYEENPVREKHVTKRQCVKHKGEFSKDEPTALTCAEDVWGRYVRIEADVIRDQYDMMTVCEVEVYGDKAVKKDWSPVDCPAPPVINNAFVNVSITPDKAVARYRCHDGFTMCKGHHTITCSSSVGWMGNPGSCLSRAYYTDEDGLGIVHFCPVTLSEAIEIYLTPKETGLVIALGTGVKEIFKMEWIQDSEIGNVRISTDLTPDDRQAYIQGVPFKLNKESRVLITFVTHALHLSVDGISFHIKTSSAYLIDALWTNKATIGKMFHLERSISETMHVPILDNLAAKRPASASTILGGGDAGRAVDNDLSIDMGSNSCWSSSPGDIDVWWMVELETLYYVSHVTLTNRKDCGDECHRRVHDFKIEMFHMEPAPQDTGELCLKYAGILPHASTTTLTCTKKVLGRMLRISAPDRRNTDDLFTLCEVEVFGGLVVKTDHSSRNLALFRRVSVSSVSEGVTSLEGVVDGNRNTMYLSNSCWSAASSDPSPWWQVELDNYYYISHVDITSRVDCGALCKNILRDFTIEVTPVSTKSDSQWDVCHQYDGVFPYGTTHTLQCSTSLLGRFLRIRSTGMTGGGGTFTLCEVEIYGGGISVGEVSSTNLAANRPVSASTRHSPPQWAVDGNKGMGWSGQSCWAAEDDDVNPWWMVELDDYYLVSEVELTSRSDCGSTACYERLGNFVIEMFHEKPRPGDTGTVCVTYKDVFPHSPTEMLQCKDKAPSRFVRLSSPGRLEVNDMLTVCEVRVFGAKLTRQGWTPYRCPIPPLHPNARVQVCHSPDRAVATYSCNTNYSMCTGSRQIFCISGSGWEGTPGTCVQTTLERHHGHDTDLSEFPICYIRLGEGLEMWVTPTSFRNILELVAGDSALRLIITPDNAEEPVTVESVHIGVPSDVDKPKLNLFKLHQASHVVFIFLTNGILIRVDDKRLISYSHRFIHSSSGINYVRSSGGLHIRMAHPVHAYMEGISRVPSDTNLALNTETRASSMSDDASHHDNLVDGYRLELGVDSLCWLPSPGDKDQWIMVDLSGFYYIKDIVLYNRVTDGCPQCTGNTHDFIIDVLQTDAVDELTSRCAVYEGVMPLGAVEKLRCKENVWGWYVRIQATDVKDDDDDLMSFCEIEVYGDKVVENDHWSLYDCPATPTLSDASVQVSYSPDRAIATYTCDKDHVMCTGSNVLECRSRAGWEGTPGTCIRTTLQLRHGPNIDHDKFSICNLQLGEAIELLIIPKKFGSSISLMFGPDGDTALQVRITPGHREGNVHLGSIMRPYFSDVSLTSDLFRLDKEAHVVFIFLSFGIFILVDGEFLSLYPHLMTTPRISFIHSTTHMHIRMGRTIPRYMEGLSRTQFSENLALNEMTSASSNSPTSDHKNLVDGDISQLAGNGKCWSPNTGDRDQWVRVEMGGYFFVREVILYGRGTEPCSGCAGYTHDFIIDVLQTDAVDELTTRCAVYEGVMPLGAVEKLRCKENVWGRYVRIQATDVKDDEDLMTFCEIQIFGDTVNKVL